jgi:hypothetical protein
LATDWSHSHLIFSRPGSPERLARVSKDPRYWQQIQRREQALMMPASTVGDAAAPAPIKWRGKKLRRDWSQDLGGGGSVGAGNYPARFAASRTTASCTADFVVFSTGLLGSVNQANIVAFNNLYSGCGGNVPSVNWAYNTVGQVRTSPVISQDGSQVAFVQTNGGLGTLGLDQVGRLDRYSEFSCHSNRGSTLRLPWLHGILHDNDHSARPLQRRHRRHYLVSLL